MGLEHCVLRKVRLYPVSCHVRRAPRVALSTLASSTGQDWQVDVLDEKALRAKVQSVVAAQSQLHKEVLDKVQANRGKQRVTASRGSLPIFFVGDYVLVARVRRSGSKPKLLMMTWTGPWRVLIAQRSHMYGVQNIVSGEVRGVHVARMRFYAGAALEITAELNLGFSTCFHARRV